MKRPIRKVTHVIKTNDGVKHYLELTPLLDGTVFVTKFISVRVGQKIVCNSNVLNVNRNMIEFKVNMQNCTMKTIDAAKQRLSILNYAVVPDLDQMCWINSKVSQELLRCYR